MPVWVEEGSMVWVTCGYKATVLLEIFILIFYFFYFNYFLF